MSILIKPSIVRPEFEVTQQEMLDTLEKLFPQHPDWTTVEKMIRNTQISKRYLLRPLTESVTDTGWEKRNKFYTEEACRLGKVAAREALELAELKAEQIDLIIVTSCTGFMMPSLTSYLISELPFSCKTKQLPIAQLGCVAGASAINRAFEYCTAFPTANVLILSVEFSSLCFQPTANTVSDLLSAALFGDTVTGCVMRSRNSSAIGFEIIGGESFLLKHTERYIAYDVKESGFHFILDKNVMHAIEKVAPVLQNFSQQSHGKPIDQLDFHVFHTGGRKILDDLATHLPLPEYALRHSRRSLKECGNISSAVVFDVLERFFREKEQVSGNKGILAAFGPGFTAEMSAGVWRN